MTGAPAPSAAPVFRVLFACVGNSARSQMAQGFAQALGGARIEARSGGSKPLGYVLPEAVAAMREAGIDIARNPSQGFDEAWVRSSCDLVVTMGCGDDACPAFIGKPLVDWDLPDPKGRPLEEFRAVRDEIERRVRTLLLQKGVTPAKRVEVRKARREDEAAVLALLRQHPNLEVAFEAAEFHVATDHGRVVGCGRLHRYPDGTLELASVAVDPDLKGTGIGSRLVEAVLAGQRGPIQALALAPGFFARHGFEPVPTSALPAALAAKATGMCASTGFVAMRRPASS